ncbi:hypothetical protein [Paraburkholderia strydomiana]|uniref:hypothetical protein n=1 Tax=Paraburkholderia strydomiana TaxID=1245417 RepID=UPI001BE660F1|nr:hypothetical protein [Paraburkholderia strydomiana]MBT2794753.1 hypothetical protein [Paraburkholderia strydomiana]
MSSQRLMKCSGTTPAVVVGYLLEDGGATLCLDLVGRFLDEPVAAKGRDCRVDGVLDMIDRSLDARRVVRVEPGGDDFLLQCLKAGPRFSENARRFI